MGCLHGLGITQGGRAPAGAAECLVGSDTDICTCTCTGAFTRQSAVRHPAHRGVDAGKPILRPHARIVVCRSGKRLADGTTIRRLDRQRDESRRQRQAGIGISNQANDAQHLLHARCRSGRGLPGHQPAVVRNEHAGRLRRADEPGLRLQLRLHARVGIEEAELGAVARHRRERHHGHLHAHDAACAVRTCEGLRGLRPLVFVRAHRDLAESCLRVCCNVPRAHGRHHQDLHVAQHLRPADKPRHQLEDPRLRFQPADAT